MKRIQQMANQVSPAKIFPHATAEGPLTYYQRLYKDGTSKRCEQTVEATLLSGVVFMPLMPGAFTPTCNRHMLDFAEHATSLEIFGIKVAVVTGDNCDVAHAWAHDILRRLPRVQRAGLKDSPTLVQDNIVMITDTKRQITGACGIDLINIDGLGDVVPRGLLVLEDGVIIGEVIEKKAQAGQCMSVSVSVAVSMLRAHRQKQALVNSTSSTPAFALTQMEQDDPLARLAALVSPIAKNAVVADIISRLKADDLAMSNVIIQNQIFDQRDMDLLCAALDASKSPVKQVSLANCNGFEIFPISSNPNIETVAISSTSVTGIEHGAELPGLKHIAININTAAFKAFDVAKLLAAAKNIRSDCKIRFQTSNGVEQYDGTSYIRDAIKAMCVYRCGSWDAYRTTWHYGP